MISTYPGTWDSYGKFFQVGSRKVQMEDKNVLKELLTPAEVAEIFRVSPKTVSRWAKEGKIASVTTLGGHRRFYADEIHRLKKQN